MRSSLGRAIAIIVALGLLGCNDEPPAAPDEPVPKPAAATTAAIRFAQMTEEARIVDVALNGEVRVRSLQFGAVSVYVEATAGDYRIQFLPEGSTSPALSELTMNVAPDSVHTVAIVGIDQPRAVAFVDERAARSDRTGVRLFNAVPDYPDSFDLAVVNGDVLHRGVSYLQVTGAALVLPGFYDFELRRSPYPEVVASALGKGLDRGANFTVFATGTLRREDIQLVIARDATF